MRKTLYLALEERLKQIVFVDGEPTFEPDADKRKGKRPVFQHFDMWNENILQLVKQRPFATPALLVEYDPIRWNYGGHKVREADILMRLHVVTATAATAEAGGRYQDKALERFDIINGVTQALLSFSFDDGVRQAGTFRQAESATDHNHEQVCDDIESWVAFCRGARFPEPHRRCSVSSCGRASNEQPPAVWLGVVVKIARVAAGVRLLRPRSTLWAGWKCN